MELDILGLLGIVDEIRKIRLVKSGITICI
jgi:hypothetical protein